jgi:MFS family permease
MPIWGKFADKYGNVKTMRITGIFIPLIPILWTVSAMFSVQNSLPIVAYLVAIEAVSGTVWAGFNLSAGNFIYDAVSRQRIAICASYFSIINGIGIVIGATLGGIIASYDFVFFGLSPLLFIFLLSALARLVIYAIMAKKINEVRTVKELDIEDGAIHKLEALHLNRILETFDISKKAGKL